MVQKDLSAEDSDGTRIIIENLEGIPPQLAGDKFFQDLFNSAKNANFTAKEKRLYKKDMLDEQSIAMHERFIDRKAREEGRVEGREETLREARAEKEQIIRNLLAMKMSIADIAKVVNLPEEEIATLRQ